MNIQPGAALHRLGFLWKRPKKRLVKADATKRAAFVQEYATRCAQAASKPFFVNAAHFRADADLRGKWTPRGQPALVDSTSPRLGNKVTYYSAVCLETGEVQALALDGYSSPEASVTFLKQLSAATSGPLVIFWDNSPAHGGEPLRHYLTTPKLQMQLVKLPPYSPDYNADEAIWEWARKDVTANTCRLPRSASGWMPSLLAYISEPRKSSSAAKRLFKPKQPPALKCRGHLGISIGVPHNWLSAGSCSRGASNTAHHREIDAQEAFKQKSRALHVICHQEYSLISLDIAR
jgi:transposase